MQRAVAESGSHGAEKSADSTADRGKHKKQQRRCRLVGRKGTGVVGGSVHVAGALFISARGDTEVNLGRRRALRLIRRIFVARSRGRAVARGFVRGQRLLLLDDALALDSFLGTLLALLLFFLLDILNKPCCIRIKPVGALVLLVSLLSAILADPSGEAPSLGDVNAGFRKKGCELGSELGRRSGAGGCPCLGRQDRKICGEQVGGEDVKVHPGHRGEPLTTLQQVMVDLAGSNLYLWRRRFVVHLPAADAESEVANGLDGFHLRSSLEAILLLHNIDDLRGRIVHDAPQIPQRELAVGKLFLDALNELFLEMKGRTLRLLGEAKKNLGKLGQAIERVVHGETCWGVEDILVVRNVLAGFRGCLAKPESQHG